MKIGEVYIDNFLAVGSIHINLEDKRLVLISGENQDDSSQNSNGAGKSSILDAISWGLYGVTARGETGDAVINNKAKKNCRVSIQLIDGAEMYTVERHRKHKEGKNRVKLYTGLPTAISDITGGTDKITQSMVEKIVGCSADVFNSSVYCGQEKMPDLPALTDKFLKQLIEEAAGIQHLKRAQSVAQYRLREATAELSAIFIEQDKLDSQAQIMQDMIKNTKEAEEKWELDRKRQVVEAIDDIKKRRAGVALLEGRLNDDFPEGREGICTAVETAELKLSGLDGESAQLRALQSDESKAETAVALADNENSAAKLKVLKTKNDLEQIQKKVGSDCSECGKIYQHEDLDAATDILKTKLNESVEELKAAKRKLSDLVGKEISIRGTVNAFRGSMTDQTLMVEEHREASKRLRDYDTKAKHTEAIKSSIADDIRSAKALKEESNPLAKSLKSQETKLTDINLSRANISKDLIISQERVSLSNEALNVYSSSGVRAHILDTVTPFLNARTAEYLSCLTDGNVSALWNTISKTKSGELREKFCIDVESLTGAKSFKGLSGGEKRKVRLSCALALQDLVSSRAAKPLEFVFCDEIDDALDDAGLERLMHILEMKAHEKGTVLVVSHNDLASWIKNEVTIVKESGFSKIKGTALDG